MLKKAKAIAIPVASTIGTVGTGILVKNVASTYVPRADNWKKQLLQDAAVIVISAMAADKVGKYAGSLAEDTFDEAIKTMEQIAEAKKAIKQIKKGANNGSK